VTTFTVHFHGGPRDGITHEVQQESPQLDIYPEEDELPPFDPGPVAEGQPFPVVPNSRYVLRSGSIADGLHYDWAAA
jgi:hypothetical protein